MLLPLHSRPKTIRAEPGGPVWYTHHRGYTTDMGSMVPQGTRERPRPRAPLRHATHGLPMASPSPSLLCSRYAPALPSRLSHPHCRRGGRGGGRSGRRGAWAGATAVRTVCPVYYTFGVDLPAQRAAVLGSVQIISAEATFQTSIST